VFTQPVPEDLAALAAVAHAGRLTVHIDRVLQPAEAVDALRLSQTGRVRRKIVLDIG
jgi:NADPH:quinone reductase-like Zn-dependent oxidoreductase